MAERLCSNMFYSFAKGLVAFIFSLFMPMKVIGRDNIPKEGGMILALNHRSNIDVIMGGIACPRPLNYMAKKELFENKFLGWLISHLNAFPLDRAGNDLKAIKTALTRLKEGKVLGIFPEGTRVKNGDDVSAKAGVSMLALRAKVPVVPGVIVGDYKIFRKVYIIFGEPISLEKYYDTKQSSEDLLKISGEILDEIKKMSDDTKKRLANGEKLR